MQNEQLLPLRLATGICQRLIERRLLSVARLPEALTHLGTVATALLREAGPREVLGLAGTLTMRLIERSCLGTVPAASETLRELTMALADIWDRLPPAKAGSALASATELALKLMETNLTGSDPLASTLMVLAETSAAILPDPPPLPQKSPAKSAPRKRR